jgi:hypothetical protein
VVRQVIQDRRSNVTQRLKREVVIGKYRIWVVVYITLLLTFRQCF